MNRLIVSLVVAVLPVLGCASSGVVKEARTRFTQDQYCPDSRVEATEVVAMKTPPPEIAQDPERLKLWREQAEERQIKYSRDRLVVVSGCGKSVQYECWVGSETLSDHPECRVRN